MSPTVALAGDTMLGRCVGERLARRGHRRWLGRCRRSPARPTCSSPTSSAAFPTADSGFVSLASRSTSVLLRWRLRRSRVSARLRHVGEQSHARLRADALMDTLDHLRAVGSPPSRRRRRRHGAGAGGARGWGSRARHRGRATTRPPTPPLRHTPGPPLPIWPERTVPRWLLSACPLDADADVTIVLAHWWPNMRVAPVPHVRRAAAAVEAAGETLIAGHSAQYRRAARPHAVRPRRPHRRLRRRSGAARRPRTPVARHARG